MEWFLLAFISALLSAVAAVSQKKILFNLEALEFSFLLSILNALFALPFFLLIDFSSVTSTALLLLYFKTILGALAFLNVMLAIKNLEISGALPLMVLTPGLVAFFAFILLGEALEGSEIFGMLLLLLGTYVLEIHHKKDILQPFKIFYQSKNHHYIIYALLFFTATSILDKALLRDFQLTPYAFMGFQQVFIAINFSIIILIKRKDIRAIFGKISRANWLWIILVALLTVGYRYTQIEAIKIAPVALVLSVKRISVFFAIIIGGKLFKERYLLRKSIATIILLSGAILLISNI
ncbi:MAG: EamA family transporter [Melioribacteraceae bacterium]|nr:EamA family transporter [Melioribacteraceae bacterium]MCF8354222.1 EamA family transporter [Melioribacteraceae bacterium]MCF8392868.1 EamA family transporter [Melioribacteraceae bacterium]MCF8418646.1 EamA family transporter [Melioribacteraceae bacterium]